MCGQKRLGPRYKAKTIIDAYLATVWLQMLEGREWVGTFIAKQHNTVNSRCILQHMYRNKTLSNNTNHYNISVKG